MIQSELDAESHRSFNTTVVSQTAKAHAVQIQSMDNSIESTSRSWDEVARKKLYVDTDTKVNAILYEK